MLLLYNEERKYGIISYLMPIRVLTQTEETHHSWQNWIPTKPGPVSTASTLGISIWNQNKPASSAVSKKVHEYVLWPPANELMLTWHYSRPTPLQSWLSMAAEMKLSLVIFAFLSLFVSATSSSSQITSTNLNEFSRNAMDRRDLDRYLTQFGYRIWKVLASHGVQVWNS